MDTVNLSDADRAILLPINHAEQPMDFTYTPEQEKFRTEIAGWLEKNSAETLGLRGLGGSTASLLDVRADEQWSRLLDYHRRLYKASYVALPWPKEWRGG